MSDLAWMLETWALLMIQGVGVVSAFMARKSAGTGLQTISQYLALATMTLTGLTALCAAGSAPVQSLICGTVFACTALTATFDPRGLRPSSC